MYETVIQCQECKYPFDQLDENSQVKLHFLIKANDIQHLTEIKKKNQSVKVFDNPYLINLLQIYQEDLTLHLVYQFVQCSLIGFLNRWRREDNSIECRDGKRDLMKTLATELSDLSDFLASINVVATYEFQNFGIFRQKENEELYRIKYFLGNDFRMAVSREDLNEHYMQEKKKILFAIERTIELQGKSEYLPNFILKGNKLIFLDEISETTMKKNTSHRDRNPEFDSFDHQQKSFGRSNHSTRSGKKHHKNSCNFDRGHFFENIDQKLNKSFDDESDNVSITQTKSMKIEIEHQKPTVKRRKNSVKFKITTFEQICIDEDLINENQQFFKEEPKKKQEQKPQTNPKVREYRQKVKEAKQKAQNLLSEYFKNKNKANGHH